MRPLASITQSRCTRRDQILEFSLLVLLYLLQMVNAEMLRRAIGIDPAWDQASTVVADFVRFVTDRLHPWVMLLLGVWLLVMSVRIVRHRFLPRWTFDGLGLWFCLRLVVEFLIINLLIFQPSLVEPGVLLCQIVLYLPFFVLSWGWFFHRLDWVGRSEAGKMLRLNDMDPSEAVRRFDYFHSAINTLLNKGKPTITGVSRQGRVAVLVFNSMLLALYTVAFARILQLTKAVV